MTASLMWQASVGSFPPRHNAAVRDSLALKGLLEVKLRASPLSGSGLGEAVVAGAITDRRENSKWGQVFLCPL